MGTRLGCVSAVATATWSGLAWSATREVVGLDVAGDVVGDMVGPDVVGEVVGEVIGLEFVGG